MKTMDLVLILSADNRRLWSVERVMSAAFTIGFFLAAMMFAFMLSMRPDLDTMLANPHLLSKFVVTATLAVAATNFSTRLARPGSPIAKAIVPLALAPAFLLLAIGEELMTTPAAEWGPRLVGSDAGYCLGLVMLLSTPLLAASLIALRHGAPTRPGLAGAAAGLASSGFAATLYALHCPNDSPLFLAVWYGIAIAIVTLAGAMLGRRILVW